MMEEKTVTVEDPAEVVEMGLTPAFADRSELALLDVQIMTAKRYPRSIDRFLKDCETLATRDTETAASMFYRLKRGGKQIEGPSVRLAEIVANTWTNIHVVARQLDVQTGDRVVRSQSVCWDLEKNVRVGVEVSRRRTTSEGVIYGDDMTGVTQAAALGIAFRNSIFKVVPFAYVQDIFQKCKEVSVGKGLTMEARVKKAVEVFGKLGVKEDQLLQYLELKAWTDADVDDFVSLRGLHTALKEGTLTVREAFSKEVQATNLDAVLNPETVTTAKDQPEGPDKAEFDKEGAAKRVEEKRAARIGKKHDPEPVEALVVTGSSGPNVLTVSVEDEIDGLFEK